MEATRTDETARSGSHDAPGGATAPAAAPRFGDVSPHSDDACRLVPLRESNLDGFMTIRPQVPRVSFERPLPVAPVPPAAAAARAAPPVSPAASALRAPSFTAGVSQENAESFFMFSQQDPQGQTVYDEGATVVPLPPTDDGDGGEDDTVALASQPDTEEDAAELA